MSPGAVLARQPRTTLAYDGQFSEVLRLSLINAALTGVTLGIYRFWAKTRMRAYFWSRLTLDGDRLSYSGRGLEIFLGFVIVLTLLVVTYIAVYFIAWAVGPAGLLLEVGFVLGLLYLIGVALFRLWRYRLSRTAWRGIRFSLAGSPWAFGWLWFWTGAVMIFSGGVLYPWYWVKTRGALVAAARMGSRPFEFHPARSLWGPFLLAVLLMIPSFGLSWYWFRVEQLRFLLESTRFGDLRLTSAISFWSVLGYLLVAGLAFVILIVIVFLCLGGLGALTQETALQGEALRPGLVNPALLVAALLLLLAVPQILLNAFIVHPILGEAVRNLTITGTLRAEEIKQMQQAVPATGEGLAEALDVDGF